MTPTDRKRAERQRRKEAGEVRVECWLTPDHARWLDGYCAKHGINRQQAVSVLIAKQGIFGG